ncbi:MAG: hypothetical protein AAB562_03985, partial [Patescibacteria group bacterium]
GYATEGSSERFGVQGATLPEFPPVITDGKDTVRFGQGALNADEYDARVNVNRWNDPEDLAVPYDNEGGRAVEVVMTRNIPDCVGDVSLWV